MHQPVLSFMYIVAIEFQVRDPCYKNREVYTVNQNERRHGSYNILLGEVHMIMHAKVNI